MRYVKLGTSDISVSVLGMGCMGIGGFFAPIHDRDTEYVRALEAGIDSGINFIDTAEAYGGGHSEEIIGRALANKRSQAVIATKVSPENLSFKSVIKAAEGSLSRLRTHYIDLYYVHWPNPNIPIAETMAALSKLLDDGKIRAIGVSNFSLTELNNAEQALCGKTIAAAQDEYSPFDRTIESELLTACRRKKITTVAYSPFNRGKLLRCPQVLSIAARHGATAAQVILSWLLTKEHVIAIPKAEQRKHLHENLGALELSLPEEDMRTLQDLYLESLKHLAVSDIEVDCSGLDTFTPTPEALATVIRTNGGMKPIRIRKAPPGAKKKYCLVEGKLRYYAWNLAFQGKRRIPALMIKEDL